MPEFDDVTIEPNLQPRLNIGPGVTIKAHEPNTAIHGLRGRVAMGNVEDNAILAKGAQVAIK